ncbi:lateral flagellin LafA [Hafnia alvei]|jgi:flagellin|uniref:Flagellin n=2 Tax=Hafnia alvei TaxID=569 RepID=A0ABD7Q4M9_HAFAL|nr:flagellin [Hafnia alvei]ANC40202.1 flagellin [Hafnia alvei]MBI0278079.1 lateral flagellin LafA [Hafnia alvei]PNK96984.1 lateral flagellin LafA [Hafnia alvei]TBL41678.1 lateral flagellin LafA [Hafnia alvei]TBL67424.1 lateral flagellin LafA [Hafnia alvei]
MALSIFTNASSMASTNALNKSNSLLSTSMERLGTGKRINSAADDAAGMQIASRLQGQTNGMTVAKRNIADATSMLQTAEGAFDEVSNIMYRMKDLATQAANDTNSSEDRASLQSEFDQLNSELGNIMSNTSYGGTKLLSGTTGLASTSGLNFQIGSSNAETLNVNVSTQLSGLSVAIGSNASGSQTGLGALKLDSATSASGAIADLESALKDVGSLRSSLGANINRLGHTSANLANMQDNTELALGNIRDADFASEASTMTRQQMLAQTSMSMLKQSNSMSGMVMSLLG